MVQYIFTPWRDRRELLAVRRQFYPRPPPPPSSLQQTRSDTGPDAITSSRDRNVSTGRQIGSGGGGDGGGQKDGSSSSKEERAEREEERESKQRAVARVSMWMQRGGCPHMVESTALLTAAILSDEGSWTGNGNGKEGGIGSGSGSGSWRGNVGQEEEGAARASRGYAVRAAYSAAFSR